LFVVINDQNRYNNYIMPIGIPELLIILVVALVIFGPKKIPEIAHSLGKSVNEFRRGSQELTQTVQKSLLDEASQPPHTPESNPETSKNNTPQG
jgi:sec-independent protein translocase protein TatA